MASKNVLFRAVSIYSYYEYVVDRTTIFHWNQIGIFARNVERELHAATTMTIGGDK